VRQVVENSQAEFAGVKSGDEIVAYNGQRVFDMNELAALIQQAEAGESVPLEMIRDGRLIQVYVDAGPIGINSAGRSPGL
jgi:serine protease Do